MYINAWRKITTDPVENNHLAVCDATSLVALDDYLASDLFMPRGFQVDAVLLSKQLDSDTVFPEHITFHTALVDPIARPDAPE